MNENSPHFDRAVCPKKNKSANVFVGGVVQHLTEADIYNYLAQFSPVANFEMPVDLPSGQWKGYAKAQLTSEEGLRRLLSLPSHKVCGATLGVKSWVNKKDYLATKDDTNRRKLFVKFHPLMSEGELLTYFERFGPIESIECKMDSKTQKPRHFGFIVFAREFDALQASIKGSCSTRHKRVSCELTTPKFLIDKKVKYSLKDSKEPDLREHQLKSKESLAMAQLSKQKYAQATRTLATFNEVKTASLQEADYCPQNNGSIVLDWAKDSNQKIESSARFPSRNNRELTGPIRVGCHGTKERLPYSEVSLLGCNFVNRSPDCLDHNVKPTSKRYPQSAKSRIIKNHSFKANLYFRLIRN